mgnify:CR=1 FL=1
MKHAKTLSFTLFLFAIPHAAVAAGAKAPCQINVSSSEITAIMNRYVPSGSNGRGPAGAVYRIGSNGGVAQSLLERNASVAQPVASTQKIMTAWTAYKFGGLSRETAFTDSDLFFDEQGNRAVHPDTGRTVLVGEKLNQSEYLYSLIMKSSNGAAQALGRGAAGSVNAFMTRLNSEAQSLLGANAQSYFQNPSGLTDSSDTYRFTGTTRRQQSTASELARIAGAIMKNSGFRSTLESAGVQGASSGYLYKLGYTQAAGKTVVATFPLKGSCSSELLSFAFFGSLSDAQFNNYVNLYNELRNLVWSKL